jgi:hypothetical protein
VARHLASAIRFRAIKTTAATVMRSVEGSGVATPGVRSAVPRAAVSCDTSGIVMVESISTSTVSWEYIDSFPVVPLSCKDHPAGSPSHTPSSMLIVSNTGSPPPQAPACVVGLLAEVVKSNVSPSQVTKKLENVPADGSHSNEPDDGTIVPVFTAKSMFQYDGVAEQTVAAAPSSTIRRRGIVGVKMLRSNFRRIG